MRQPGRTAESHGQMANEESRTEAMRLTRIKTRASDGGQRSAWQATY